MVFNQAEEQERSYLQQIINRLKQMINHADVSVKDHVDTLVEYKDYLWNNKDIDPHEIRSICESILNHFVTGESVIDKRRQLAKIVGIPYFGRIDFQEKSENHPIVPVYIGVHTFHDAESRTTVIYDWRAPISSMFYDYELGETSYQSPSGEIKGDISLKRQYRTRTEKMEFMIESALTVHDDILQKELSSNADDKVENIVATIQQEQNLIIRNKEARTLIIQGVAGSGKTSIALHRIAYSLCAFQGSISSKDILIISPNKVLTDYVSSILSELGEETVPEISMEQILSEMLNHKYKYLSFFEQVNELLTKSTPDFIERIGYKSSFDFIASLDRFISHIENHYFRAEDVKLTKHVTVPAEFIEEQFHRSNRYPMRQRFEVTTDYILDMVKVRYAFAMTTAERNFLKKETKRMFAGNNDLQVYKDFFAWMGRPELFKMRKNRTLEYAGLAPLAYLHIALEGGTKNYVKHLLVGETQDYSPIQYKVTRKLFSCRKTVLGNASQSVNPYGSPIAGMIQKALVMGEVMGLCKSYHSTYEITDLAQKMWTNTDLEPVTRHGEKPKVLQFSNEKEELSAIKDLIAIYQASAYKSLGIVCKTESQACEMADKLQIPDIHSLSDQSSASVQGIVITSAHMARGLEFDEVIIPQADDRNHHLEIDRSILYVTITRTMHRLTLTYSGTKHTPFI